MIRSLKISAVLFVVFLGAFAWVFMTGNSIKGEVFLDRNDTRDSLFLKLEQQHLVKSPATFKLAASVMSFRKIYPGKYVVGTGMSNRKLVNLFKYGQQTDITFRFGNNLYPGELMASLGKKFEADSLSFAKAFYKTDRLQALSLDSNSALGLFWADTYRFPWTVTPEDMMIFFLNDQTKFWDPVRMGKLAGTGLRSTKEVYILASIVEKEAMVDAELPIIAGVYLNRLRIGMALQADPTVKYALGVRLMQRVTGVLDIESPYNTYKYPGLPPGPIGLATKKGVDAVLNYQAHNYLYFCAKEDFSGTHNFAKTFAEHKKNSEKYHAALDAKGIK